MTEATRVLAVLGGVVLIVGILSDAVATLVVTQGDAGIWRPTRIFYAGTWRATRAFVARAPDRLGEFVLNVYPALSLLALLVLWLAGLMVGWSLVYWGAEAYVSGARDWGGLVYYAGASLVTPLFGSAHGAVVRMLTLVETLTGVATIALVISYLPALYGAYSRRESRLLTLDDPRGGRITPVRVIAVNAPGGDLELLYRSFAEWEQWIADVLESHVSYPMLALFRSQHQGQSWVTALGVVTDAATLASACIEGARNREPYFVYRRGRRAVLEISSRLHAPSKVEPTWLVEENFELAWQQLCELGVPLRDKASAWADLQELRSTYGAALENLIVFLVAPRGFWGHSAEATVAEEVAQAAAAARRAGHAAAGRTVPIVPVPLPTPDTVNLTPPDAAEAQLLADGVATAVAGAEGLLPVQERLIEAFFPAMTGHHVEVGGRPAVDPDELALALSRRDAPFRSRAVQVMLLCALVRNPMPPDVAENVCEFARALGVEEGMLDVARDFATGTLGLAVVDFQRNGYTGAWDEHQAAAAVHASRDLGAWEFALDDAELALRWAALEQLPADTIGRKVWEMYRARGFHFPGSPGSAPPLLAQHDWVHVLGDYGTTVESEVEVFGLIARANDDMHAFSLLAMVISLFETGLLQHGVGLFDASPGHFSGNPGMAVRLSDAMRRGALCHDEVSGSDSVDFLALDWFSVAGVSCDELRARFHLVPKAAAAVEAGSVGPWEPGGISPFQLNAGRELADATGSRYDAYGASL